VSSWKKPWAAERGSDVAYPPFAGEHNSQVRLDSVDEPKDERETFLIRLSGSSFGGSGRDEILD
jgi:hypothetical protein